MASTIYNGKTLIQIADIAVGGKFYCGVNGPVYTKVQEVGATGGGWCYCANAEGETLRFQWDQYVEVVEGEDN
jgi:hypothetical protein